MRLWINIAARLIFLPLIAGTICAAIPHWIFTRSDIDVPRTMTMVAAVAWGVTFLVFLTRHQWLNLVALGLATLSVVATWGVHVLLARRTFRMYIGVPSVSEFAMAAMWWGVYFAILFAVLYPLHQCEQMTFYSDHNKAPPYPGIRLVEIFAKVNFGIVAIIAIITATTGSYEISFPTLATLNLPLQTVKDYVRPSMGSGGYMPGSMMLYAVFGTAFQCGLAWLICRLGYFAGLIKPAEEPM